jgi:hypothetical protein
MRESESESLNAKLVWNLTVWYGAPSTPCQCVPFTEGGGFIQHLPDARGLRQAGHSALVRAWVCLCGRWSLDWLLAFTLHRVARPHTDTAKVIGLNARSILINYYDK